MKTGHARFDFVLGKAAFVAGALVIAAHNGEAAIKRVLFGFNDAHIDARGRKIHRNAAAHGARADDANGLDVTQRGGWIKARDLPGFVSRGGDVVANFGLRHAHAGSFR